MRVVILGAGTVGTWVADLLCQHRHSVVVVDQNPEHTRRLNDELDVAVVTGSASQASVLFQAGVIGSDICLGLTGIDEVNIIGASMAKAMGASRAMARVYAPVFRDLSTFDYQRHFRIDRLLSLEHLSAVEMAHYIRNPGSVIMENFSRGELEVQDVIVHEKSHLIGKPLKELKLPVGVRVGSINRDERTWIGGADDAVEAGDRVTLIGQREKLEDLVDKFVVKSGAHQRVVIAGAGETGYHLARILESSRTSVLLMEHSRDRCEFIAAHLKHATVVHVDATRRAVLEEERVGAADVFVACTGDDENNIMAGVEAREIGAKAIMAVVGRPDYAEVVNKLGIDVAVSPRDVMAKQVLSMVNPGPILSRMALRGSELNVMEIDVPAGARATTQRLADLQLPPKCLVAALLREEFVTVPGPNDRIQQGDTALILVENSSLAAMLEFFQADR